VSKVYVQNFISEASVFRMYDRLGALIFSHDIGAAGITEINLSKLRQGLFIVQIEDLKGGVLHRQKLVLTDR
jgi:hypothetical protein